MKPENKPTRMTEDKTTERYDSEKKSFKKVIKTKKTRTENDPGGGIPSELPFFTIKRRLLYDPNVITM